MWEGVGYGGLDLDKRTPDYGLVASGAEHPISSLSKNASTWSVSGRFGSNLAKRIPTWEVDVAIAANDDSIRAIELVLNELADAVAIGKTMSTAQQGSAVRQKRARSKRPALARAEEPKEEAVTASAVEQAPAETVESSPQEGEIEKQEA